MHFARGPGQWVSERRRSAAIHRCRYLDTLIGPYPQEKAKYDQRSPINAVDAIRCPVAFFQGMEDKIVPPNQAEMMFDALKAKVPTAPQPLLCSPVCVVSALGSSRGRVDGNFVFVWAPRRSQVIDSLSCGSEMD